ncbi:MAG: hypothetical protein ACOX2O_10245 [Bdellovibrionota bacterium]|jgi:hypothetical protein
MAGAGLFQGMAARRAARANFSVTAEYPTRQRQYSVTPQQIGAATLHTTNGESLRADAQRELSSQNSFTANTTLAQTRPTVTVNSVNTPNTGATSTTPQNATPQHENKLTPTPINVQIPGQTGTYPLTAFKNSTGEIVCYGPNSQGTNAHIADQLNSKLYTESVRTQAGDDILRYDTKKVVNIRPSDNPKADYTLPVTQYTRTLSDRSVLTFYGAAPGGVNQHIADKLNTALLFKQIEQDAAKQTNTGQQTQAPSEREQISTSQQPQAEAATPNPTTKDKTEQTNTDQAEKLNTENVTSTKKADPSKQMASKPTWPHEDTADTAGPKEQPKPTAATQNEDQKPQTELANSTTATQDKAQQPQAGAATPNPTTKDEPQQTQTELANSNTATQDEPQQTQALSEATQASTSQKPQTGAATPDPATKKSAASEKQAPKENNSTATRKKSDGISQNKARSTERPSVMDRARNMVQKGMETTKQIAEAGGEVISTLKTGIDTVGSLINHEPWAGRILKRIGNTARSNISRFKIPF